jgi:hypothetical protein
VAREVFVTKRIVMAILVTLALGAPIAFADGAVGIVSAHPVPGSGAEAGGGGPLFEDGTARGNLMSVDRADDEVLKAEIESWQFLAEDTVEICLEFKVVKGDSEFPPGLFCIPFPIGEPVVVEDVVITVTMF